MDSVQDPIPKGETTQLHMLAQSGDHASLRSLGTLSKPDLNAEDENGQTPISRAAENGRLAVVKLLARKRNTDINREDFDRRTPLGHAAKNGHATVVEFLLRRPGIILDEEEWMGGSPVSWAVLNGHEDVLRLLIEYNHVDVNSSERIRFDDGEEESGSLLCLAAGRGHAGIVSLLLQQPGALFSWGALEAAAEEDHVEIFRELLNFHRAHDGLLRRDLVEELLPSTAGCGSNRVVKSIIEEYGISARAMDRFTRTAIIMAVRNGHESTVRMLLEYPEVDIEEPDDNGTTLLQLATNGGHDSIRQLLATVLSGIRPRKGEGRG